MTQHTRDYARHARSHGGALDHHGRVDARIAQLRQAAARGDRAPLERWLARSGTRAAQCRALQELIKEVQGLRMDWIDVWIWCWATQTLRQIQTGQPRTTTEARRGE